MVLAQSQCRYCVHQSLVFLEQSDERYACLDLRLSEAKLFVFITRNFALICTGHLALLER